MLLVVQQAGIIKSFSAGEKVSIYAVIFEIKNPKGKLVTLLGGTSITLQKLN